MSASSCKLPLNAGSRDESQQIRLQPSATLPALILGHKGPEFCPGALSNLAKLLCRPAITLTEVRHLHLQVDLAVQHESLVERELRYDLAQSANVALHFQSPLNGCSTILDLGCGGARTVDRDCSCQSRFDAAAASKSSPTVINPAYELLLKRVFNMVRIRKRCPARANNELESCLAVAVLKILESQPLTMSAKEQITSSGSHVRHDLGWIRWRLWYCHTHRALLRPCMKEWDNLSHLDAARSRDRASLGVADVGPRNSTPEFADTLIQRPTHEAADGGRSRQLRPQRPASHPRRSRWRQAVEARQLLAAAEPSSSRNGLRFEHEELDLDVGADVVVGDEDEHGAAREAFDGGDEFVLHGGLEGVARFLDDRGAL